MASRCLAVRAVKRGQGVLITQALARFVLILVFRLAQEISHQYGDRNQQVVEFDLQKKGHRLLIAASMDVSARGAGNFSHDPSLGKISNFFQTLPDFC